MQFEIRIANGDLLFSPRWIPAENLREFLEWVDEHAKPCSKSWFIELLDMDGNTVTANVEQIASVRERENWEV